MLRVKFESYVISKLRNTIKESNLIRKINYDYPQKAMKPNTKFIIFLYCIK